MLEYTLDTLFLTVKSCNFSRWLFTESFNVWTTNRSPWERCGDG